MSESTGIGDERLEGMCKKGIVTDGQLVRAI